LIHNDAQQRYEEKFECNSQVNFHDLWEFISRKLGWEGENAVRLLRGSSELQLYLKDLAEVDEGQELIVELEKVLIDKDASDHIKKLARL